MNNIGAEFDSCCNELYSSGLTVRKIKENDEWMVEYGARDNRKSAPFKIFIAELYTLATHKDNSFSNMQKLHGTFVPRVLRKIEQNRKRGIVDRTSHIFVRLLKQQNEAVQEMDPVQKECSAKKVITNFEETGRTLKTAGVHLKKTGVEALETFGANLEEFGSELEESAADINFNFKKVGLRDPEKTAVDFREAGVELEEAAANLKTVIENSTQTVEDLENAVKDLENAAADFEKTATDLEKAHFYLPGSLSQDEFGQYYWGSDKESDPYPIKLSIHKVECSDSSDTLAIPAKSQHTASESIVHPRYSGTPSYDESGNWHWISDEERDQSLTVTPSVCKDKDSDGSETSKEKTSDVQSVMSPSTTEESVSSKDFRSTDSNQSSVTPIMSMTPITPQEVDSLEDEFETIEL
jgi:hypothetical protein